jgi:transposase
MEALMARFDLTDTEWTIIAPLLPGAEGKKNGRPRPDDRKVLNGIFFVLRTGTPWRDLPERYGPYCHSPGRRSLSPSRTRADLATQAPFLP